MNFPLNTLGLSHKFISEHLSPGAFCIDATAGRGRDTVFLASLCGKTGKVLAFDIQKEAIESTRALVKQEGYEDTVTVICDSHSNMARYADKNSADAIMFNLGWLPGGDHSIFSRPETSIPALDAALEILKPGGVMSVCVYHGKNCGTMEKDALTEYFKTIDNKRFTVITLEFSNRTGEIPVPVFILKDGKEKL